MGSLMKKAISEQEHRDQEEGFMKKHDNHQESSDSFVVDIESLSSHHHATGTDRDVTANSRITMQRSFSRKGSIRGDRNSITLASPAVADDISNGGLYKESRFANPSLSQLNPLSDLIEG
ncbi:hypothetical protein GIB67_016685 [Kingdonia uniflora]|uniref:Uncharacterized protein n=1 Tax=Kingdonia uniflora TaxID=39325 RepID=A0A7J7ME87_9MAGN|nr:hypothetical protein GIB67_016685 [Kingdonia uniflora]